MNLLILTWSFSISLIVAGIVTPLIARLAKKRNWVDVPGKARSMHKKETPRAGGLAILLAFFAGLGVQFFFAGAETIQFSSEIIVSQLAFPLGCIAIALVGLYDDAYGLGFKKKFLFQGIIGYTMFLAGFRVPVPELAWMQGDPQLQAAIGLPLTLLWYLWVMNAVNLIDGLDGLASGVSMLSMISLAAVFGFAGDTSLIPITVVVCGALIGFLFHNFNPAKIFLGDTGSLFLGFLLATASLEGVGHVNPWIAMVVPAIAIGFPLLDTSLAFLRRFLQGGSPFAPDKDHIHHRLTGRFNLSVKGAVLRLYLLNTILGAVAVGLVFLNGYLATLAIGVLLLAISSWLKHLGYPGIFDILRSISKGFTTFSGKRVPRGEWTQEMLENEAPKPEPVIENNPDDPGSQAEAPVPPSSRSRDKKPTLVMRKPVIG